MCIRDSSSSISKFPIALVNCRGDRQINQMYFSEQHNLALVTYNTIRLFSAEQQRELLDSIVISGGAVIKEKTFVDKFKSELSRFVSHFNVLSAEDTLDIVRGGLPFLNTVGANKGLLEPRPEKWQKPHRVMTETDLLDHEEPYPQNDEYPHAQFSDRLYDFVIYESETDF
eukprot:TRINITY_DN3251_c0_g1_i2.p1 TRINITY_DN3251_c0_g1~~TRINITY_DN3251_c0_g1_i2.p1  ORF type:complete len:171 (+),score=36.81 TRINITY_DN3251_c0_g1_i2:48-560(+)